jgi:hypothetical protein
MSHSCPPPTPEKKPVQVVIVWQKLAQDSRRILLGTLRLRRVQVALVTMIVTLLIFWFPMLEGLREQLLMLFAAFLMVALGGYTVNDAYSNGHEDPKQERLEALLEDLVEEMSLERQAVEEALKEEEEKEQVYDTEA